MGETRPANRALSCLVGVGENFRDADGQEDRHSDDGERDQKHTSYELDRFVGLLLFLLRFIHMPINAHPIRKGAPSQGGLVSRIEKTDPRLTLVLIERPGKSPIR